MPYLRVPQAEIEDFLSNISPLEDTHEENEELVLSSQAPLGQARGKRKAEAVAVAEPSHQAKIARSTNSAQEATFDLSDRRQARTHARKVHTTATRNSKLVHVVMQVLNTARACR